MTEEEFADLARYNREKDRGLVHSPEWEAKMAQDQMRYNQENGDFLTQRQYEYLPAEKLYLHKKNDRKVRKP